jgi:hypothetical protein
MELKDILGFVDLGEVKTIDEFKEKFKVKFITKDEALGDDEIKGKITGKVTGAATTLFKRLFELENKEIEGKKWEEIAEIGVNKLKGQIKELEGKQGQSNDQAIKDLQAKLESAQKTVADFKSANETLKSTYDKDIADWQGKFKGLRVGNLMEKAKSSLTTKLKSDMTEAERLGYEAAIERSFVLDFDEKDAPVVKDKEGKRIPNPNKAGSFLSLEEALELKATELNLIKKNNGSGSNQQLNNHFNNGQQQQNNGGGQQANSGRTIHPNALSHAERLKAQGK